MYYGFLWTPYGVASDRDGEAIGAVFAFPTKQERDAWVAKADGIPRSHNGYREPWLAKAATRHYSWTDQHLRADNNPHLYVTVPADFA